MAFKDMIKGLVDFPDIKELSRENAIGVLETIKGFTDYELSLEEKIKDECRDLIEKVNKLNTFKATKTFYELDRKSKDLLYAQSRLMDEYIQILGKRLELLDVKDFIKGDK